MQLPLSRSQTAAWRSSAWRLISPEASSKDGAAGLYREARPRRAAIPLDTPDQSGYSRNRAKCLDQSPMPCLNNRPGLRS